MGRARAFDDLYSWGHFFFAMVVTMLDTVAVVATSILYVAYQYFEKEKWEYKRGDFVEYMAGVLAGLLADKLLWVLH